MTRKEFLDTYRPQISANSTHPQQDLVDFLMLVTGSTPTEVVSNPEVEIAATQLQELLALIQRQNSGEPHALIVGYVDFFGERIDVRHKVLIPRPETEQLVELFLADASEHKELLILEVGVGSGCIAKTVTEQLDKSGTEYAYVGIDPSEEAIQNTALNTRSNDHVILKQIAIGELEAIPGIDMIISNPPYVTDAEMTELPVSVSEFEPKLALAGGANGTDIYDQIGTYIEKLGYRPDLYLEISPSTASKVKEIFDPLYTKVEIKKDLFGRDRFLLAK